MVDFISRDEGESNQQSCEGVMNRMAEQGAWDDLTGKDYKINETGLKWVHLQHLCVSKVSTRHHYGVISQTLSRPSTCWDASLKWLYGNAGRMWNKHNEFVLDLCAVAGL